jgi:hypothetical protein
MIVIGGFPVETTNVFVGKQYEVIRVPISPGESVVRSKRTIAMHDFGPSSISILRLDEHAGYPPSI